MSSKDIAISVRGLSKSYTIRHNAQLHVTAAEAILSRVRHPMRRNPREDFWALRDVSLDVEQGEVVGVVGRNGAGKSTLLKVLSRITTPSRGEVHLYGRVGSLLEVGTGFHSELTGRENIYLNGTILGMRRREIKARFDDIVSFAGVEQFLDTPVKRYSNGMSVRLAFSVAAHLDTDVLIVDEILAVGDQDFQTKCVARMRDVAAEGRTILFVSHNLQAIRQLCTRAVWIRAGRIADDGEVEAILARYSRAFFDPVDSPSLGDVDKRPGSGEFRIMNVEVSAGQTAPADVKAIQFEVHRRHPYDGKYWISAEIFDEHGSSIVQCDSRLAGHWIEAADRYRGELRLSHPWLRPGRYTVTLYVCAFGIVDRYEGAVSFEVPPLLPYAFSATEDANAFGIVLGDFEYREIHFSDEDTPTTSDAARAG